jgi:hypothetical protein
MLRHSWAKAFDPQQTSSHNGPTNPLTETQPNPIRPPLVGPGRQRRPGCAQHSSWLGQAPSCSVALRLARAAWGVVPRFLRPQSSSRARLRRQQGGADRGARGWRWSTSWPVSTRSARSTTSTTSTSSMAPTSPATTPSRGSTPPSTLTSTNASRWDLRPPPSRRLSASAALSPRSESDAVLWSVWHRKRSRRSRRRTGPRWWRSTPISGEPRPSSSRRTCPSCSASRSRRSPLYLHFPPSAFLWTLLDLRPAWVVSLLRAACVFTNYQSLNSHGLWLPKIGMRCWKRVSEGWLVGHFVIFLGSLRLASFVK